VAAPAAFIDRLLPAPKRGGLRMDDYWVWCGSVIRGDDGFYHMYASRWPKRYPFFSGYVFYSEVVHATSKTAVGPYRFADVALPARGETFWDGRMTHNPTIHRSGDTYLLFYIGSTFEGPGPTREALEAGRAGQQATYNRIRIGVASARSPAGPWKRLDRPILEPRPGKWDGAIVTNPSVSVRKDGSVLLIYRSNTPKGLRLGIARAPRYDGPYERLRDEPILQLPDGNFVEDPYFWETGGHFEMLAKDMRGGITGEYHAGAHLISQDALEWKPSPAPKAYSRTVRWDDGTESTQGSLERPQLLIEKGRPTHLVLATSDGPGGGRVGEGAKNTWNIVIPLR
jgi:hypothetical protein